MCCCIRFCPLSCVALFVFFLVIRLPPISPRTHTLFPYTTLFRSLWRSSVIADDGRVNRISYALCVLTQLRDRIRSKEIWVVGADRYRTPDDDLPKEFEIRRHAYYSGLSLTPDRTKQRLVGKTVSHQFNFRSTPAL